jgi:hypothetical protein
MGHIWLGILMILAIDAFVIAVVLAMALMATGLPRGPARRQARRFADAVARHDFQGAEAAAERAMTVREQPGRGHLTSTP